MDAQGAAPKDDQKRVLVCLDSDTDDDDSDVDYGEESCETQGGFVVNGEVHVEGGGGGDVGDVGGGEGLQPEPEKNVPSTQENRAAAPLDGRGDDRSPDPDVVCLSSDGDDDDDDEGGIEVLTVLPLSESRRLSPLADDFEEVSDDVVEVARDATANRRLGSLEGPGAARIGLQPGIHSGYIKEFVDGTGLGVILSEECGLILFHASHAWVNGRKFRMYYDQIEDHLIPGTKVSFKYYHLESERYRGRLNMQGYMRQAGAVWTSGSGSGSGDGGSDYPEQHMLRLLDSSTHQIEMKAHRDRFMDDLKNFMPMALVRTRGKVEGYVNEKFGIIYINDEGYAQGSRVLFHASDVLLFRKQIDPSVSIRDAVPPGLTLAFDARAAPLNADQDLAFQACAVFAGSWPQVPHPTLLPGGPGTFSSVYDNTEGHTFYYLQLNLKANLDRKWLDYLNVCPSGITYMPSDRRGTITSGADYTQWRHIYAPPECKQKPNKVPGKKLRHNFHVFKQASAANPYMLKHEINESKLTKMGSPSNFKREGDSAAPASSIIKRIKCESLSSSSQNQTRANTIKRELWR